MSRSRESLADVSAVELTRNPVGLARALRTISDDPEVLEVANRATQHLYIVNPIKSFENRAKSMWDTHPPLAERIAVLQNLAGQFGQDRAAIGCRSIGPCAIVADRDATTGGPQGTDRWAGRGSSVGRAPP